ncbi:MAG TPA: hypothetical protein VF615_01150 [Longimicrobiaceae bacterium]|jgi:hypothetical protein
MRGYGRDYNDQERWLSGGSEIYRDRMRHNPSWEDQAYGSRGYGSGYQGSDGPGNGGGYGGAMGGGYGGRSQNDDHWRRREYSAGEGSVRMRYGSDYNDYGQGDYTHGDFSRQQPMRNRGAYDRDMGAQGQGVFQRNRGHSGAGGYGMSRGTGYGGTGLGNYSGGGFGNPTNRGDFFLGYGASSRRGYSPFW